MNLPYELIDAMHADLCASLLCRNAVEEYGATAIPQSTIVDSLGFHWCQDCTTRQYLIDWGKVHNWPVLVHAQYAVAEGLGFWTTAALLGTDEYVCALLAATEAYDRRAA